VKTVSEGYLEPWPVLQVLIANSMCNYAMLCAKIHSLWDIRLHCSWCKINVSK